MLHNQLWTVNLSPGPQYMDDTILVAGLQRGETRAVEYVVQQYAPALYRYAYYQLQDAMLAEDVVSEVMARMVGRVDKFVLESTPFQAWLFRIARNLIADHYREIGRASCRERVYVRVVPGAANRSCAA